MLGVLIWWFISARKWFKGPKVNIEHQMLGREGNVLEAREAGGDSSSEDRALDEKKVGDLA